MLMHKSYVNDAGGLTAIANKIVPLGQRTDYLQARRRVAERGMKLPSDVLHDEYLVKTTKWARVEEIYPAWAREILVHPARNGRFSRGKDVVDRETGWCLPGNYLTDPKHVNADVFRKWIGLFVDPAHVEKEGERIIVIPASIVVLYPFIQKSMDWGKVDEATGVPLAAGTLIDGEKRWLYRMKNVEVRPIVRGRAYYNISYGTHSIVISRPDFHFWVAGEVSNGNAAGCSDK
jgi:hypothetical protein